MKKVIVLFAGLFLMAAAATEIQAQTSASTTAASSAYIVTPIAIVKAVDLNFGKVVATPASGTVVLATNGSRTFNNGAYAFANATGTPTAAEFNVTGENNATYSITLTNATVTVTNGLHSMTIDNFVTNPTPTGTLSNTGTQTIKVGATLNVGAGQAPGLYTNANSLEITVAYN